MSKIKILSNENPSNEFESAFLKIGSEPEAIKKYFLLLFPPSASACFFVALENNEPVGRMSAGLMRDYPDTGTFGLFEASSAEVAQSLIDSASVWMKARGAKTVYGPMAFNTWFPYRFREDSDPLQFSWEPKNPVIYNQYFLEAGFVAAEHYHSPGSEGLKEYAQKIKPTWEKLVQEGYQFRPFDSENFMEKEVEKLYSLSIEGFKNNKLYEPISLPLFKQLYSALAAKQDYSYSYFAVSPEGKEIGFFFIFVEKEYLVLKTIVVDEVYRGKGISTALSYLPALKASENGIDKFTTALIHRGNHSASYNKKSRDLWDHRYVLYRKDFL